MREITYVDAIREALAEEMRRDAGVFLMGEDVVVGSFGVSGPLFEEFGPERVRNTPISESGFVGAGVGAALAGLRPVAELQIASFAYVAMDQICNQAAKLRYMSGGQARVPLTVRAVYGWLGGGAGQHSTTNYAQFMSVPGLKIAVPTTPYDAKGLLKTAIRDDDPVLFFEHGRLRRVKQAVPEAEYTIPFGLADVKRQGDDVTIVAIGWMVARALAAAATLAAEGISVEVVDPRTLVPLDKDTILQSVEKTNRLIVVDEGPRTGSAAAEIAAIVAEEKLFSLETPIKRVCALDVTMPYSAPLEQCVVPDERTIADAVRQLLAS